MLRNIFRREFSYARKRISIHNFSSLTSGFKKGFLGTE